MLWDGLRGGQLLLIPRRPSRARAARRRIPREDPRQELLAPPLILRARPRPRRRLRESARGRGWRTGRGPSERVLAAVETLPSRTAHEGERLFRMNPSTSSSESRNRSAKSLIARVRSLPVVACTMCTVSSRRSRITGSRGTPSPISSSGQIGMSSTSGSSFSRRLARITWPSYRQESKSMQRLMTTTGRMLGFSRVRARRCARSVRGVAGDQQRRHDRLAPRLELVADLVLAARSARAPRSSCGRDRRRGLVLLAVEVEVLDLLRPRPRSPCRTATSWWKFAPFAPMPPK